MTRRVTVALAGDVMLGRLVADAVARRDPAYPWGDLVSVGQQADLFLVNLECALTERLEEWRGSRGERKAFYFRADPASATATLTRGRVAFASLANNHAGDFGMAGLLDTVEALDRAGIVHAGAGANLAAARKPGRLAARGQKVAVVAFADHPVDWAATPTSPGINYLPISTAPDTMAQVKQALAAAREGADLVVFSIHWGPNMRLRPTATFRAFARRVIELGADVFWGHSAHVVQGIEVWEGKPILFDTGDFVDDYAVDPELRNDLSALFLLQMEPPRVTAVELLPVRIGGCQVNRAGGVERDWFLTRIENLCAELGTTTERRLDRLVVPLGGASSRSAPTAPGRVDSRERPET